MNSKKAIEIVMRIGVFGTFFSHGILALFVKPEWISLITCFGFSVGEATRLMPIIGMVDITVAFITLFYPIRIVLMWAVFWAFMTALSRPISGMSWLEFFERAANWALPLTLLLLQGFPKSVSLFFKIRDKKEKPSAAADGLV